MLTSLLANLIQLLFSDIIVSSVYFANRNLIGEDVPPKVYIYIHTKKKWQFDLAGLKPHLDKVKTLNTKYKIKHINQEPQNTSPNNHPDTNSIHCVETAIDVIERNQSGYIRMPFSLA